MPLVGTRMATTQITEYSNLVVDIQLPMPAGITKNGLGLDSWSSL